MACLMSSRWWCPSLTKWAPLASRSAWSTLSHPYWCILETHQCMAATTMAARTTPSCSPIQNAHSNLLGKLEEKRLVDIDQSGTTLSIQFAVKTVNAPLKAQDCLGYSINHIEQCASEGDTALAESATAKELRSIAIDAAYEAYKKCHDKISAWPDSNADAHPWKIMTKIGCGVGVSSSNTGAFTLAILDSYSLRVYNAPLECQASSPECILTSWLLLTMLEHCCDIQEEREWEKTCLPCPGEERLFPIKKYEALSELPGINPDDVEMTIQRHALNLPLEDASVCSALRTESPALFLPPNCEDIHPYISFQPQLPKDSVVIPGSFNPFHVGHASLGVSAVKYLVENGLRADTVESLTNKIVFELSATNVDKPPINRDKLVDCIQQICFPNQRLQFRLDDTSAVHNNQHDGKWPVLVTSAPRFIDKARLLPNSSFVIGYDTAIRLVNPKYYDNSRDEMIGALIEMRRLGCEFIVACRSAHSGKEVSCELEGDGIVRVSNSDQSNKDVLTLKDMAHEIPSCVREMFIELPLSYYRLDLSSSAIRKVLKPSG